MKGVDLTRDAALAMEKRLASSSPSSEFLAAVSASRPGSDAAEPSIVTSEMVKAFWQSLRTILGLDMPLQDAIRIELMERLEKLKQAVQPKLPPAVAKDDWGSIASCHDDFAELHQMVASAHSLGEQHLVAQLKFYTQVAHFGVPLAKLMLWLQDKQTRAQQVLSKEVASRFAALRSATPSLEEFLKGGAPSLPSPVSGSVSILDDTTNLSLAEMKINADEVSLRLPGQWLRDVQELCDVIDP